MFDQDLVLTAKDNRNPFTCLSRHPVIGVFADRTGLHKCIRDPEGSPQPVRMHQRLFSRMIQDRDVPVIPAHGEGNLYPGICLLQHDCLLQIISRHGRDVTALEDDCIELTGSLHHIPAID